MTGRPEPWRRTMAMQAIGRALDRLAPHVDHHTDIIVARALLAAARACLAGEPVPDEERHWSEVDR